MSAVTATLRDCKVSARKARLVADQIRGKRVQQALDLLALSHKRVARPIRKLVKSALAGADVKNDREKAGIDVDNLVVSRILVDEGASLWRIRARAQGRANWIQRRTSHITVELEER
jgi:large subunit ribosomal protein L22